MPANIEIKARVKDFTTMRARAAELSDSPCQIIAQEDTFFHVPHGRLKLRQFTDTEAQLIAYQRPDGLNPKKSQYQLVQSSDPQALKSALAMALGVRGVVRKKRYLYMLGQTRIHLDDVEGLGYFVELEVVLREEQTDAEGQKITQEIMQKLGISSENLLENAYMDMLEKDC